MKWIESHFGTVLILACVAGLFLPPLAAIPDQGLVLGLALLTFTACFRLSDGGFRGIDWPQALCFLGLRYFILPLMLLGLALFLAPAYAPGILLLALLPAGVSCPALTHLFGGRVALAFALTIPCFLLAPFYIPAMFALTGQAQLHTSPSAMFHTLVVALLLPVAVYALIGRKGRLNAHMRLRDKTYSILLVAAIITIVIAKQRETILAHPIALVQLFALVLPAYALFMFTGWFAPRRATREERIAYMTCSTFNNAALGVSLALLHFSAPVVLLMVAMEFTWALLPIAVKQWLRWQHP
jgi:BASS family bile acid:Na+ symporter